MTTWNDIKTTPEIRIISFPGLDDRNKWPKADSGKCCVFEAINIVGRARFGSEWTGTELRALNWVVQPEDAEAARLAMPAARLVPKAPSPPPSIANLSWDHRTRVPEVSLRQNHDHHVTAYQSHLAAAARAIAVGRDQSLWEENNKAKIRLMWPAEWLAQRCRDGDLISLARLRPMGALWPVSAWEWNKENVIESILSDGGHLRYFTEFDDKEAHPCYIFFDRAKLENAVSIFEHAPLPVSDTDLSRLSPYLRMAIVLALRHDLVSASKSMSRKARVRLVREAWAEGMPGVPMSDPQVEHLQAVMGWPNVSAISAGLNPKAKKSPTP